MPDLVHSRYADAGYGGVRLSNLLGVPLIHTGHSLGRDKRQRLLSAGVSDEEVNQTYNIDRRVDAEEEVFASADLIVANSNNAIDEQYGPYGHYQPKRMAVDPAGFSPAQTAGVYPSRRRLRRGRGHDARQHPGRGRRQPPQRGTSTARRPGAHLSRRPTLRTWHSRGYRSPRLLWELHAASGAILIARGALIRPDRIRIFGSLDSCFPPAYSLRHRGDENV